MSKKEIINVNFSDAISERYLSYALSTITSRSLPDVRDGLKPVHRRLLYAMRQLRLNPNKNYKKSARVVGDVMGKFHPHGDSAIYDSMVRMAQSFSLRYPMVDGQGNFGNIDGDNAAAMRYTEARMTIFSELLLKDIDEDTVNFRETYDGEDSEPVVLPSAIPNLLANGSQGIAVGMATSIPPHNLGELFDATLHLIKFPNASNKKLLDFIKGPDFPTGGVLIETKEVIEENYNSGRGGFRLRAKWQVEKLKAGLWQLIITEIPYQVQKSKLIEKIANLIDEKKLPMVSEILDESSQEIRIVIEPRSRNLRPEMLMETLFKLTDLEIKVPLNLNFIDKENLPGVRPLKDALKLWLDHRNEVLIRRSNFRYEKISKRINILDGYLVVFKNLDRVIMIIREEEEPKKVLMKEFKLNELQVNSILDMRLRSLRRLEEIELKKEMSDLVLESRELKLLLESKELQQKEIASEIKSIKSELGDEIQRLTSIEDAPDIQPINVESFREKELITIVLSYQNWIRSHKGHLDKNTDFRYRDGDKENFVIHAQSTDKILFFTERGYFYTLNADKLPSGRGVGEPLTKMFDLNDNEKIISIFPFFQGKVVLASSDGLGFKIDTGQLIASTRSGKRILSLNKGALAKSLSICEGDFLAVVGYNRKMLVFPLLELPEQSKGKGVILQRYKDGLLSDIKVVTTEKGITWRMQGGRQRIEKEITYWIGKRGTAGKIVPNGFPRPPVFNE
tara:strand:- start:1135 stop:3339 length:2205 start_codon:yes stop_codon:yes gene_type:complete